MPACLRTGLLLRVRASGGGLSDVPLRALRAALYARAALLTLLMACADMTALAPAIRDTESPSCATTQRCARCHAHCALRAGIRRRDTGTTSQPELRFCSLAYARIRDV